MAKLHLEIDLKKIERLRQAIKEFPEVLKEELGQAVLELALIIQNKAKELCPVDTGLLRSSINAQVESWAAAYVGTNTEYAPWVEYGTRRTPAQPFLEPAFEEGHKQADSVFSKAVKRAMARLERMAGK